VQKGIISAVKKVEWFGSDMSYIMLSGFRCEIIVLNVHAPTQDKYDDTKDNFYEELEHVFNQFPKYHDSFVGKFQCKSGEGRYF
jgi:hypothetical protein